jgi:hypothetical protein
MTIRTVKKPTPMAEIVRIEPLLMAATPHISREEPEDRKDDFIQPRRKKGRAKVKQDPETDL